MPSKLTRRSVLAAAGLGSVSGCLSLVNGSDGQPQNGTTEGSGFATEEFGTDVTAPMVRYDELNTGAMPEASGPTAPLTERWATEHSLGSIVRPTVLGKMVFIHGINGVSGLTIGGERRWVFEVTDSEFDPAPLAVVRDRVYATRTVALYALDAKTGDRRWGFTPPIETNRLTAPAIDGDTVYVVGQHPEQSPTLWALANADGAVRWRAELGGDTAGPPVVTDDRLYCATTESGLYTVDTSDEAVSWQRSLKTAPGPPAATAEGVVASTRESVVCYNRDGSRRWRTSEATGSDLFRYDGPVVDNTVVYTASSDGEAITALDIETGDERWRTTLFGDFRSPIPAAESVYVMDSAGGVRTVGRNDGAVGWAEKPNLNADTGLTIGNGSLFVGADDRLLRYD